MMAAVDFPDEIGPTTTRKNASDWWNCAKVGEAT
jgi:hypothetical protein